MTGKQFDKLAALLADKAEEMLGLPDYIGVASGTASARALAELTEAAGRWGFRPEAGVDRDKLAELKERLWRANEQAMEIRELAGRLIARNNDLIWQVFCLAEGIEPDGSHRKQAGAGDEA